MPAVKGKKYPYTAADRQAASELEAARALDNPLAN